MKNLFSLDNPLVQLLTRLADLILLSLLCLVCCLPVVTIGAAITAAEKTATDLTFDQCSGVTKTFFHAFRTNFKQATIVWVAALVVLTSLVCDYILLRLYFEGTVFVILMCLVALFAFLVLAILAYFFPLLARYENTLQEHIRNAVILSIYKFPKTIVMVLLHIVPVLLFLFAPTTFLYTLLFWILMGFGFETQVDAMLLKPVFEELEKQKA